MTGDHPTRGKRGALLDGLRKAIGLTHVGHGVRELRGNALTHLEPCAGCGEETAVGSIFFSDRRTIEHPDGSSIFLCTLCDQRIAAARHGQTLDDEDLRRLTDRGAVSAMVWGSK